MFPRFALDCNTCSDTATGIQVNFLVGAYGDTPSWSRIVFLPRPLLSVTIHQGGAIFADGL